MEVERLLGIEIQGQTGSCCDHSERVAFLDELTMNV
jgi:hypothetical protein